jgi:hypothetical protein
MHGEKTRLGKWGRKGVEALLRASSTMTDLPARIDFISAAFLGVPYAAGTLGGPPGAPGGAVEVKEALVIDLSRVDCFTYLDYVEAMRLSRSYDEFRRTLAAVRYRKGEVAYATRRHFFTDWAASSRVADVTTAVGGAQTKSAVKVLNLKEDGGSFVPGLPHTARTVAYVPSAAFDGLAADRLRTGDYVGIYAEDDGLDVKHTGIAVAKGTGIIFRHASQIAAKVIDEDLMSYLAGKPGIVVLRPR